MWICDGHEPRRREREDPNTKSLRTNPNSLFTGTKRFSDGDGWEYLVTINGNNITFKLYPTANNEFHTDKTTPEEVILGHIEGAEIITPESSFRIEEGALFELNNEGGWNEYKMVK